MILVTFLILIFGILLSAFFSGNEMGFYRVTRLNLVMDGLRGDKVAKRLLWLINNPTLFVATTLAGNNIANYLTSLAIVIGCQIAFTDSTLFVEIAAPILLSPILFIYGESLPKNLFMNAPHFFLRKSGLLFTFFFSVLLPISALLWLVGKTLEKIVGQSPVKVRLALAKKELDEILQEGQDAGILQSGQRALAHGMFSVVNKPVRDFLKPLSRYQIRNTDISVSNLKDFARKQKVGFVAMKIASGETQYVKVIELLVTDSNPTYNTQKLIDMDQNELMGNALLRMQTTKQPIARIVDSSKKPIGFVTIGDLSAEMFAK